MWILEEHRCTGATQILMDFALERMKHKEGYKKCVLVTSGFYEAAMKLYRNYEFAETKVIKRTYFIMPVPFFIYYFEKSL